MALNYSLTQYVLVLDVDLLPSFSAYAHLCEVVHFLRVQQSSAAEPTNARHELGAVAGATAKNGQNGTNGGSTRERTNSSDQFQSLLSCAKTGTRCAFVLPAFESTASLGKYIFAGNKSDLCAQMQAQTVAVFKGVVFPSGHAATDYPRWYNASSAYRVAWEEDYEPYVMLRVKAITHEHIGRDATEFDIPGTEVAFDPRFVGFGFNKATFIQELHFTG